MLLLSTFLFVVVSMTPIHLFWGEPQKYSYAACKQIVLIDRLTNGLLGEPGPWF